MFWDCCQEKSAELLPVEAVGEDGELKKMAPYPESSEANDLTQDCIYTNYDRLIERYTECDLTFESDKLVAFSGLTRRLCHQLKLEHSNYVAGLWKTTLSHDLLWRVEVEVFVDRIYGRRVAGRAPSWSWASVDGPILTLNKRAEHEIEQRIHVRLIEVNISYHKNPQQPTKRRINILNNTRHLTIRTLHHRSHQSKILNKLPEENPFGKLEGGHLRVQGPVCAVNFGELSHEQLQDRGVSFLWIAEAGSNTFWDDSASEVAAKNGQCVILVIQTHRIPGGMAPDYCGLVLQPTGLKRGQFQRLGVVLHEFMWGVTDLDTFLHNARNPERLEEAFYQEADPSLGFTIEII